MNAVEHILLGAGVWQVLALASSGLLLGCAAQSTAVRPPSPFAAAHRGLVIAHRGGSLEAPENTLAAIAHGVASGADWQEIDVTLTADDEVVVIHDDTMERTTSGKGRVETMAFADVRAAAAGHPKWSEGTLTTLKAFGVQTPDFGNKFAGEKVPTLREVLDVPGSRLMIELKKTERAQQFIEKVLAIIVEAGAQDRVALGSFQKDLLERAHALMPELPLIGIVEDVPSMTSMSTLPLSVLAVRIDLIEDALAVARTGVAVWSWTAYSVEMAAAVFDRGAHGVITDAPVAVIQALQKR